jgi:hypothetical protein
MADYVVTEKADGATRKARQVWVRHKTEPGHDFFKGGERIGTGEVDGDAPILFGADLTVLAANG